MILACHGQTDHPGLNTWAVLLGKPLSLSLVQTRSIAAYRKASGSTPNLACDTEAQLLCGQGSSGNDSHLWAHPFPAAQWDCQVGSESLSAIEEASGPWSLPGDDDFQIDHGSCEATNGMYSHIHHDFSQVQGALAPFTPMELPIQPPAEIPIQSPVEVLVEALPTTAAKDDKIRRQVRDAVWNAAKGCPSKAEVRVGSRTVAQKARRNGNDTNFAEQFKEMVREAASKR